MLADQLKLFIFQSPVLPLVLPLTGVRSTVVAVTFTGLGFLL